MLKFSHITKRSFSCSKNLKENIVIDFFTKQNCGLCSNAKIILDEVLENPRMMKHRFYMSLYDIDNPRNKEFYNAYCYDVPVLHIYHENQDKPKVFMHKLTYKELFKEFDIDPNSTMESNSKAKTPKS